MLLPLCRPLFLVILSRVPFQPLPKHRLCHSLWAVDAGGSHLRDLFDVAALVVKEEHRREREENNLECLKLGNDTIDQMVKAVYQDVSESLHAAAARSLFATVIYLVEQKKVEAMDGLDIHGRYVLM